MKVFILILLSYHSAFGLISHHTKYKPTAFEICQKAVRAEAPKTIDCTQVSETEVYSFMILNENKCIEATNEPNQALIQSQAKIEQTAEACYKYSPNTSKLDYFNQITNPELKAQIKEKALVNFQDYKKSVKVMCLIIACFFLLVFDITFYYQAEVSHFVTGYLLLSFILLVFWRMMIQGSSLYELVCFLS